MLCRAFTVTDANLGTDFRIPTLGAVVTSAYQLCDNSGCKSLAQVNTYLTTSGIIGNDDLEGNYEALSFTAFTLDVAGNKVILEYTATANQGSGVYTQTVVDVHTIDADTGRIVKTLTTLVDRNAFCSQ